MTDTTAQPANAGLFHQPVALDPTRHQYLTLNREVGFGFAAAETAVPLVATEFAMAARDLPIVFAGPARLPMIVLGLRTGQNLMIDEQGAWRPGRYVPAHLRRYPFVLQEEPSGERFALCIDEAAEHFRSAQLGEPLFTEGNPSPIINEMLQFLGELQGGFVQTQEYVAALVAEDLLVERTAVVELKTGERVTLDGFHVVDEDKFGKLPVETLTLWAQKGWLPLTYFHLQSRLNWALLVDLAV